MQSVWGGRGRRSLGSKAHVEAGGDAMCGWRAWRELDIFPKKVGKAA